MFVDYETICGQFPWSLTEVKDLTKRERDYWVRVAQQQQQQRVSTASGRAR